MKNVKLGAYDASPAQNTQTNASTPQMPQSIAAVRPERGYSLKIYDISVDNPQLLSDAN